MSMTHREALRAAKMATGVRPYGDIEALLRVYIEARGLVLVPRDRVEKLLVYADSDYVPNVLFDQFRDMIAAAPDPFAEGE